MDPGRAYSTAGSAHSIPIPVPGMYDYTNGGGTQSTSSNSSLESHMSLAQQDYVTAGTDQAGDGRSSTPKSSGYGKHAEASRQMLSML